MILLVLVVISYLHFSAGNTFSSDRPLLLLISFDGFRWDYLLKHNLTNFNSLKHEGVHADFIRNSFTTITFPNHWTLVTGLYEETHGIVQNTMYDPNLNDTFNMSITGPQDLKWFAQNPITEPIWATNQRASSDRLSAAEWVASDAIIHNQSIIHIPYNRSTPYKQLIDQFIQLFTRPEKSINFGALYFDEPDHTGHLYGPYSNEMSEKLKFLDKTLGYLIERVKDFNLYDKLNIIITSDHGMEKISNETAIYLDDYVDENLFDAYGSRVVFNVFVKNESNIDSIYEKLKTKATNLIVFKKKEIPDDLHYKNNDRIGHLVLIAKLGYAMFLKKQSIDWSLTNGEHGYLNNETSMYPIFIAHGPAFKKQFKIEPFNNVDIYPLMCFVLGIQPAINNGSLENVLDMLELRDFSTRANIYLLFLLVIPFSIVSMTITCLCLIKKGRLVRGTGCGLDGYTTLSSNEDSVTITVDSNDDENGTLQFRR